MANLTNIIRPVEQANVDGKIVLVRADLNVPMDGSRISDTTRISRIGPTLRHLADRGARIGVMSHFGRPNGEASPACSLEPVAAALEDILGIPVGFVSDCVGENAKNAISTCGAGEAVLLENLRFHPGEEANETGFARQLAALGDIYVNDAFSCCHRAHASIEAIARLMPSFGGLSLIAELSTLDSTLRDPNRPVVALVGGAKVSSKISVLENLIPMMDAIIVGGGMANTFLLALGFSVGKSLAEPQLVDVARNIVTQAEKAGCEIVLPTDVVVADEFKAGSRHCVTAIVNVPDDGMILDIGPRAIADLTSRLEHVRTLLWNGPLGAFELDPFGKATLAVARAAGKLTQANSLTTVAGGGDTVAALNAAGVSDQFTFVSTAGGAFLEWLEGKTLPGVAALIEASSTNERFE